MVQPDPREEVKIGLVFRLGPGGGGLPAKLQNSLDGLAGHCMDLATANAEVGQLAVGEFAQFVHRRTVLAPVTIIADEVHFTSLTFLPSGLSPKGPNLDCPACNGWNIAAVNSEILKFAIRQTVQF